MTVAAYTPTAPAAKQQANALLTVLVNHPLPVDAQIVIGSAAAFLAEVQRVLPDTVTAKQKRRLA